MNDKELWEKSQQWDSSDDGRGKLKILESVEKFADLIRADEREALIRYFDGHWRSDWSDGQIIEAIEARGNT
jgi:hypothetical protein